MKRDENNSKSREKELYWWKTWEGSVYDGKVKSNHIPEKNLKRMKLVKTHH